MGYPKELVEETKYIPNTKIRIPLRWEEFLQFRYGKYGSWKKPVKNWSTYRDDRGFVFKSVEEIKKEENLKINS